MLFSVYTVFDKVAKEFGPPFTAVNDGIALRKYKQMQIPESLKDDYELHLIGSFDSTTGVLVPEMKYELNTEVVTDEQ